MLALLFFTSALCLTVGSGLTLAAQRRPSRRPAVETVGVVLIIAGLAIIGFGIAMFDPSFHRHDEKPPAGQSEP